MNQEEKGSITKLPTKSARGVKRRTATRPSRIAPARPLLIGRGGDKAERPAFWTFDLVQERMVEAYQLLGRMPDRERAWLAVRATDGPWDQVVPERLGKYEDTAPARLGLRTAEVDRMEEALGWLRFTRPADRKLIGLALKQLASDQAHVEWGDLKRALQWTGTPDALRMRYSRSLTAICHSLNAAENLCATRQA